MWKVLSETCITGDGHILSCGQALGHHMLWGSASEECQSLDCPVASSTSAPICAQVSPRVSSSTGAFLHYEVDFLPNSYNSHIPGGRIQTRVLALIPDPSFLLLQILGGNGSGSSSWVLTTYVEEMGWALGTWIWPWPSSVTMSIWRVNP